MIAVFFLSLFVGFSGAIVPGPLFVVTLTQALSYGWAAGIWLVLGHIIAEFMLICILKAGLGTVLQRPIITKIIGLVGGAVLLYFAWMMISVLFTPHAATHASHTAMALSTTALIIQGVVLSVINPYWYLWWATAGVGMIGTQVQKHGQRAWPVFFTGHILSDTIWYVAVSVILAISGSFLNPAIHRGLIGLSGIGVAIIGAQFIYRQVLPSRRPENFLASGD